VNVASEMECQQLSGAKRKCDLPVIPLVAPVEEPMPKTLLERRRASTADAPEVGEEIGEEAGAQQAMEPEAAKWMGTRRAIQVIQSVSFLKQTNKAASLMTTS